jgi:hypothetical protein
MNPKLRRQRFSVYETLERKRHAETMWKLRATKRAYLNAKEAYNILLEDYNELANSELYRINYIEIPVTD